MQLPPTLPHNPPLDLAAKLDEIERHYVDLALHQAGGNRTEAARLLGIARTTLVEKLRRRSSRELQTSASE